MFFFLFFFFFFFFFVSPRPSVKRFFYPSSHQIHLYTLDLLKLTVETGRSSEKYFTLSPGRMCSISVARVKDEPGRDGMSEWPKSLSPICITWFPMLLYLAANKNRTREREKESERLSENLCSSEHSSKGTASTPGPFAEVKRERGRERERERAARLGRVC